MDCATNHIPLNDQLKAMLRLSGVLIGLPIVEVEDGTHADNALRCDNNHFTFEDLLKSCIGVDSCAKPAIRVKFINTCDTLVSCSNNVDADPMRQMFAYDSDARTYCLVINKSEPD